LVNPQQVRSYALAKGWLRVPEVNGEIALFRHPASQWDQLLVPLDETFDDYDKRIFEVVQTLAGFEARSPMEVLDDLLIPDSDVLRFRVTSLATARGSVPLIEGINLLEGVRRSLLATACSVVHPVPYHPRMSRTEALQLIGACRLGQTERGSFTVAVSCPLRAVESDQVVAASAEPFARSTTSFLMRSLHRIIRAIEADQVNEVFEVKETEPVLSANLCDALLQMQPSQERSWLDVSLSWATTLPPQAQIPTSVRIKSEYFPFIEDMYKTLRPLKAPAASLFFGYVLTLNGQPGDDGRMQGETTLSLLYEEDVFKARADLSADDYQKAIDAHRNAEPVKFWGVLHLGRRIHRLAEISGFSVLQQ
jgi:hypothetical protein